MKRIGIDDSGKATVWAMLLCVATLTLYLKAGRAYLDAHVPPLYNLIIMAVLAICAVATLGCSVHMLLAGDKSSSQLRKELKRDIASLREFVDHCQARIEAIESHVGRRVGMLSPRALIAMTTARRIILAIGRRTEEVNRLMASRRAIDVIDAHELMSEHLSVIENCMESLIGADPIPPLPREEWFPIIESQLAFVEGELSRAESAVAA